MKKSRVIGALCAAVFSFITLPSHAAVIPSQGTWTTTLLARDFDGYTNTIEGYYDTVLNITWLADASANGEMTWTNANNWAAGLSINGVTGWRLPTMIDNSNDGCNYAYTGTDCGYDVLTGSASTTVYSEMASMFYDTLGNLAYYDTSGAGNQTGWGLTNTGPFDYLQSSFYWSGLEYAPNTGDAWYFDFYEGGQSGVDKTSGLYAWAVHDGDVGAPVDTDGDQIADSADNCILVANAAQIDTDTDGHGNACDGDFQNNCLTNIFDTFAFKANFAGTDQLYDLDSTGGPVSVNIFDLFAYKGLFGSPPGPSACGVCPCPSE